MDKDFMIVIGMVLLGMFMFVGGLFWVAHAASKYECEQYGNVTGLETTHMGFAACMIKDPEKGWMSYEERKLSRVASE